MKFSFSWLQDHLDTQATPEEVAETLTRIGLEVESVENPAERLAGFHVAKVLTAERHPQADKLQILSVDAGKGPVQVVCGAPNARAGMIGVFGAPGAVVPSNGMELRVAAIRGVESHGMMCSSRELELGDDHDGIIELPADAAIGTGFADYSEANDPVFDVAITPNRQDCMGVYGIARDLAAAGLGELKALSAEAVRGAYACPTEVRIEDTSGCPAFYGRVIRGVTNGSSPDWMQARLKAAGQRPISALVDITNYVMLAYGRPAHAYDLAKLTGAMTARRAKVDELVIALNGKSYTLTSDMTVIADEAGVHDIAGIMGGEHSGCSEDTTDVLLEIAYFTPERIARTGQTLALTSDARSRFERGVDPAFLDDGLDILSRLIVDICGGEPSDVVRVGAAPVEAKAIRYDPSLCRRLGGIDVAPDKQKMILESLGFTVGNEWKVAPPSWRRDVDGAADLVEEVIRIHGLDLVIAEPLLQVAGVARPTATPLQKLERKVRRAAAARGLHEAITWSFIPETQAAAFAGGSWTLANPISEDMKVMRPSLLPGLLSAAQRNIDRGGASVRLFEIGRRYLNDVEGLTLGLVLAGERNMRHWSDGKARMFDAFDAKAEALALLAAAGAPTANIQVMDGAGEHFHPGQSATLRLGPKSVLASFGMLHPATAKAFGIDGPVVAAEIYLDAIPLRRTTELARSVYAPPALQSVIRDFAFFVPAGLQAGDLLRSVTNADKGAITAVRLFDRFAGAGVPEGQVSLALEVTLQPQEKSFGEEELSAISERIVSAATKLGAVLRG